MIPGINFDNANFTFEEYLVHNMKYELDITNISSSDSNMLDTNINMYKNDPQHIIIFTDDFDILRQYDSKTFLMDNRTIDYVLYLPTENQTILNLQEEKFYREETDKFLSSFHIMTPGKNGNAFSQNICNRVKKATQFKLLWWHWALIGVGIFLILSGCTVFYRKFIRQQDPYDIIRNNPPIENKEEFLKEVDKLRVNGKFSVNFNVIKGQGVSSTVYEAIIKRCLLPEYPRRSFDNNISEDCIVAAKILNQFEKDQIDYIVNEIEAARKLEKHEKICTLLGHSKHLGAPCLFFEMMETDLFSYLISLRQPISESGSESGSTLTLSVAESERYSVPDFDERQQKIFLQILWQASQGLEYIASKNIVHRDVAARNILISPYGDNETYAAKIADFGLCVNVDETTKEFQAPSNKGLPLKICAIECHIDRIYSEASDIWAFGLLMIEVYSLSATLYPGIGTIELPEKLKSGKRMPKPDRMSQDM
uniref:Protein kinase domain-containing protein n=1 Tax=Panagrolaimus sp. ES5 TaxID=591445 RepID=A0AC34FCK6_9BILA